MKIKIIFLVVLITLNSGCFGRNDHLRDPKTTDPLADSHGSVAAGVAPSAQKDTTTQERPDVTAPDILNISTKHFFQENDVSQELESFTVPSPIGQEIIFKKYVHTWGALTPHPENIPEFFVFVKDQDSEITLKQVQLFYKVKSADENISWELSEWIEAPLQMLNDGTNHFRIQLSHFNLGHVHKLAGTRHYEIVMYALDKAGNKSPEKNLPFTVVNMKPVLNMEHQPLMSVDEDHSVNDFSEKLNRLFVPKGIAKREADVLLARYVFSEKSFGKDLKLKIQGGATCFYSHEARKEDLSTPLPKISPVSFKERLEVPCELYWVYQKKTDEIPAAILLQREKEVVLLKDQTDKLSFQVILPKGAAILRPLNALNDSGLTVQHQPQIDIKIVIKAVSPLLEDEFQTDSENWSVLQYEKNLPLLNYVQKSN
ncbi:MAG: hypothetical protein HYS98_01445 [Deltaproteobacteria bacterium]|nr:hypothetical protein [Deltaproteobacteria bacterium]